MLRRQIVVSLRNWWWGCTSRAWTGRGVWCGAVCLWFLLTAHITILTPQRRPPHPTLTHQCYQNTSGLQRQNLCCRLHNYTKNDIIKCVRTATTKDLYLKRYPSGERQGSSSRRQEGHFNSPNQYLLNFYPQTASRDNVLPSRPWVWVIVGDSRVRQVFSALITRISSPRLKYNKPSTGGKWRRVHELDENLRIGKLHEDIEVYHEDVPWNLTFIWDPRLTRLPKLLQRWTLNPQHRPTLLLLGSGLHWMKTTLNNRHQSARSQVALDKFQWHMNSLRTDLAAFATSTYTILQFLDHIQESGIFKEYTDIYSNHNIDQYNTFLSSFVKDTDIIPWNSNVLLSDLYHSQCRLHHRISYDKQWSCDNPLHTGYVMVEEYANMILNDVCNCYLGLDSRQIYC